MLCRAGNAEDDATVCGREGERDVGLLLVTTCAYDLMDGFVCESMFAGTCRSLSVVTVHVEQWVGLHHVLRVRSVVARRGWSLDESRTRVNHLYSATIYYRPLARTLANALHRSNLTDV